MSYVDAHLHLADASFAGRIEQAIADASMNHVQYLLSNAVDYETATQTIALAKRYPAVLAAVGMHPSTVTFTMNYHLEEFERLIEANAPFVSAIGEIGLDGKYSKDEKVKERQLEVFRFFLKLAERLGLPAVIHSRLAVDEMLENLSDFHIPKILLHWYDGPVKNLGVIRKRGYLISIGPAVLYSRGISEVARTADLGMILSETDAPVKYRGPFESRPTQPSFVVDVIRTVAEIKQLGIEEVRDAVWGNFRKFLPHLGTRT